MATFFQSVRQGFGRGSNRNNNNNNNNQNHNANNNNANNPRSNTDGAGAVNQAPSQYASNPPSIPQPAPMSPALTPEGPQQSPEAGAAVKYFFQEKYAPLNVKGNFLTLCACPKNVELGEWIAHQMVEQYRLLQAMLQVIQETNTVTGLPICNDNTCPTMTAGNLTYTWLIDGKAAKISAPKFINRVERWIVSKIHDPVMFPTTETSTPPATSTCLEINNAAGTNAANGQDWIGKSSGFPPTFYKDCQGIMRQMFRCYGHLYHGHWDNPFYHINKHEILNMCFVHFVTVAKYYRLVADKEMEPMQPLIDIFTRLEKIPPEALAGHWAQSSSPKPSH